MTDAELVQFAKDDHTQLTKESLEILQKQFEERQIDWNVLETSAHFDGLFKDQNTITDYDLPSRIQSQILDAKEQGFTDDDIVQMLMNKGIPTSAAVSAVQQIENNAKLLYNDSVSYVTVAWVCFFTAIILIIFISTKSLSVTSGIYALMFLFVCAITGLKGYYKRKKYLAILKNIQLQERLRMHEAQINKAI
jgi:hypothetical protein